jgi:quinolinate synthase
VHERFTGQQIRDYRARFENTDDKLVVIAHPECPPEVTAEADFVGSTSAMINYAKDKLPKRVLMVTECSMSDNVAAELPEVEFIRPCNLCPHMKRITLPKILDCLENLSGEITIEPALAAKARLSVERMLEITDKLAMRKAG